MCRGPSWLPTAWAAIVARKSFTRDRTTPRQPMRSLFPTLGGFAVLILLVVGACGWANESLLESLDRQTARIDELEQTVSGLLSKIDTLKGSWSEEPVAPASSSGVVPGTCLPAA